MPFGQIRQKERILCVMLMVMLLAVHCYGCHCCCANGLETSDEKLMNLSIVLNSGQISDAAICIAMNSQGFTDTVVDI